MPIGGHRGCLAHLRGNLCSVELFEILAANDQQVDLCGHVGRELPAGVDYLLRRFTTGKLLESPGEADGHSASDARVG